MGVREKLNEKPGVGIAIVAVVVICVVAETYHFMRSPAVTSSSAASPAPPSEYFTTDDGATYFDGAGTNVAPFDYNGKEAVRAYVFRINGKQVVGYLEKHIAGADSGLLVKKPGARTKWIADSAPEAQAIKEVKGTGGADPIRMTPPSD
jgi:hypothetical protein